MTRSRMRRVKRGPDQEPEIMLTSMVDMFTIMLVFLLFSNSSVDLTPNERLQLPLSTSELPAEFALKVVLSKDDIAVGDRSIVPIKNGAVSNHFKSGLTIIPLYDELESHVQRKLKLLADYPQEAEKIKEKILLMADEKTPASLLDEVLFTISQREFGKFHLVVMQKPADVN